MLWRTMIVSMLLASPLAAGAGAVDELMSWLSGEFVAGAAGEIPEQQAVHAEIRSRALDGRLLFMQWRQAAEDGDPGELTRQRLWQVAPEGDAIRLRFYAFHDHRAFEDLHRKPIVASALRSDDLRPHPEACAVLLRKEGEAWRGAVDASDCRLDAALVGRDLALEYALAVDAGGFSFHEAGFGADGSLEFRTPAEGSLRFERR
jgi:hypothetical protein